MRKHHLQIGRRVFLRAGASSGLILAALPLWRHSAPDHPHQPDPPPGYHDSGNQSEELRRIALKYGGEFGEVGKEQ